MDDLPLDRVYTAAQARENLKQNRRSRWSGAISAGNNDANPLFAANRIDIPFPDIEPPTALPDISSSKVFALGSCFAREIEDALLASKIDVTTADERIYTDELFQTNNQYGRKRAFLNRYNPMAMLSELINLTSEECIAKHILAFDRKDGLYTDLHYSNALDPCDLATLGARRRVIHSHHRKALLESSILIFTFGLCECWRDRSTGQYLNVTPPGPILLKHQERLEFCFLDFHAVLRAMEAMLVTLRQIKEGTDYTIIFSVSPVPLEATFSGQDIVVANSTAKATLRAAVGDVCSRHSEVSYFPSYEIVMNSFQGWNWDKRHVHQQLVNHITNTFVQHASKNK